MRPSLQAVDIESSDGTVLSPLWEDIACILVPPPPTPAAADRDPRRQQLVAQVPGPPSSRWETLMEIWRLDLQPTPSSCLWAFGSKPAGGRSLSLFKLWSRFLPESLSWAPWRIRMSVHALRGGSPLSAHSPGYPAPPALLRPLNPKSGVTPGVRSP